MLYLCCRCEILYVLKRLSYEGIDEQNWCQFFQKTMSNQNHFLVELSKLFCKPDVEGEEEQLNGDPKNKNGDNSTQKGAYSETLRGKYKFLPNKEGIDAIHKIIAFEKLRGEVGQEKAPKYLIREICNQYLCRHPCVCQIYSWYFTGQTIHLYLEKGEEDLGVYINKLQNKTIGEYKEKEIQVFIYSIAFIVYYINMYMSISHGDIKPENFVVFTQNETTKIVKIIDFGLSRSLISTTDTAYQGGTSLYYNNDNDPKTIKDLFGACIIILQLYYKQPLKTVEERDALLDTASRDTTPFPSAVANFISNIKTYNQGRSTDDKQYDQKSIRSYCKHFYELLNHIYQCFAPNNDKLKEVAKQLNDAKDESTCLFDSNVLKLPKLLINDPATFHELLHDYKQVKDPDVGRLIGFAYQHGFVVRKNPYIAYWYYPDEQKDKIFPTKFQSNPFEFLSKQINKQPEHKLEIKFCYAKLLSKSNHYEKAIQLFHQLVDDGYEEAAIDEIILLNDTISHHISSGEGDSDKVHGFEDRVKDLKKLQYKNPFVIYFFEKLNNQ